MKLTLREKGGALEIYERTLEDLELTDAEVDAYLAEHADVVKAALEAHGRPLH